MKTFSSKKKEIKRIWHLIDAEGKILGRLASKLSYYLRGKHKSTYTPHIDNGDYCVVINASKIVITGNKINNKIYYHYTGYVGGIKKKTFKEMINIRPEMVIKKAVKGMLPRGPLGRDILRKLKVYPNKNHKQKSNKLYFLNI